MIPNKKIVRGIAQDYAPIDMPQGAMRTARNIYLNDTLNAVSNEKGFNQLVDFTNNIVGSILSTDGNIRSLPAFMQYSFHLLSAYS
jgi:hypothetical protein